MKATITVGISASGKTTWAREEALKTGAIITNRDDLRFSLTGAKDWSQYKFNRKVENTISMLQIETMKLAVSYGNDLIIADTNLNRVRRLEWVDTLKKNGFTVEIKSFPVALEEALRRDSLRANGVGKHVIYRQWKQWLEFTGRLVYKQDESLPKAVMFDIDGTLAHMVNRKPYDWDSVGTDVVDKHLRRILQSYSLDGYKIIVVSGRDGTCFSDSAKWLYDNELWYDKFFIRNAGDMRKDTVIKEEIFWRDIAPYYNVEAVFDDRPSVVRMWHDIGIPKVFAVADQNIEF